MNHALMMAGVGLALLFSHTDTSAHPGHARRKPGVSAVQYQTGRTATQEADSDAERWWIASNGAFRERGSFVMARDEVVQIRRADDTLVTLPRDLLPADDERWVIRRMNDFFPLLLAQRTTIDKVRAVESPHAAALSAAFAPFEKLKAITTRHDDRWFFVESNGIPDHRMMVGITAWQQQVPLPQKYVGENAWQIPLHPVPAKTPATTKNRFLRGAIAVAVNGIPIFNPLNNRGDDAFLFGELDEFGGHCGRADDYHYHLAPVHLEKSVGKGKPIAYALDGYPIYGYEEPDGSPVKNLDALNGHKDKDGHYHYHATKTYPYLNGGFHGEVTERGGQVDPQPRTEPIRPDLRPLRDAKITSFRETKPKSYLLTYEVRGKQGTVAYTLNDDGSVKFTFTDTDSRSTSETYSPKRRPRDRDDDDSPPRREDDRRRPPRPGE